MHWIALQPTPDAVGTGEALVDATTALAWWALQFSPLVARVDAALVLEVSGSERLYGGRAALVRQIFKQNKPVTPVECAQGATSLVALGRLWSAAPDAHPDALPLQAMAVAREHVPTLLRLGCTTWGQLRALPRGGVARRFGGAMVDALDRAYGSSPEVYPWVHLPEVFDAALELSASVEDAPALLFGARRLLAQLHAWLQARQHGVLALELLWELDARRSNALHVDAHHGGGSLGRMLVRTSQPTQDMQHLQRLLAEQLARVRLPAPVLHLRLRSLQTQALAGESRSLLPEDLRPGDSLHQLLERLSARLGSQHVQGVELQAGHCPERAQRWHAASGALQSQPSPRSKNATKSGAVHAIQSGVKPLFDTSFLAHADLYPTWLLNTPQRLVVLQGVPQYQGRLDLLAGPQRLESGWLEGEETAALRDYFVARSRSAGLVWVYRERLSGRMGAGKSHWYLHGLFA
jgi:protein ImuB